MDTETERARSETREIFKHEVSLVMVNINSLSSSFGQQTPKLTHCFMSFMFVLLRLTVTAGEVYVAAGAGTTVLSGVVWFAETATGQILTGTVSEL